MVVRWYLKTTLMFILGVLIGMIQSLNISLPFILPGLTPVYFHLLMAGWISPSSFLHSHLDAS
ncbi:hypothetical protein ATHL_01305 [Anaerolinea thermolimosa]|nr:hypothetical protein ATHL_01305 [Anaerolinea thermolimosa]